MKRGRESTDEEGDNPSAGRLEAFSDGVIAVIITVMVLELKIPVENGLPGLLPILKTLAVYALSFTFTGIFWVNHHHQIHRLKHVDGAILYANLGLLFFLSLLPFFTSYMVAKGLDSFSVAVYAASLVLSGLAFLGLTHAIGRHLLRTGEMDTPAERARQRAGDRKGLLSQVLYAAAIPLAFWRPGTALALIGCVTLLWVVPGFAIGSVRAIGEGDADG